jgi:hypothetical protein
MIELQTDEEGQRSLSYAGFDQLLKSDAGFFDGAISAPFVGIKHAWDVGAAALSDAAMPTIEAVAPESISGWFKDQQSKAYKSLYDTRPDPSNMGTVAQIGHSLGSVLTMGLAGGLIAGPTGAAAAIGSGSYYDKFKELRGQGVDEDTAMKVSGVTGAVMGIGAALPAFMGKAITTQVLSGIGMNVPLGVAERGATANILEGAGYKEMASHYKMLDYTAIATDAVLGAAFPFGARALRRSEKPPLSEIDAAQDANRGLVERTRNPATPGTLEAADNIRLAEDSFAKQMIEEGKSIEDIEVPRGLYDESVENPSLTREVVETTNSFNDLAAKEGYAPLNKMEQAVKSMDDAYTSVKETADAIEAKPEGDIVAKLAEAKEGAEVFTTDRANRIADENSGMTVADESGNFVSAKEMLNKAEAEFQNDIKSAKLSEVAIKCALGVG